MANESAPVISANEPGDGSTNPINPLWAALLGIYLLGMSLVLSYMLYNLWPPQQHPKAATAAQVSDQTGARRKTAQSENANNNTSGTSNTNAAGAKPGADTTPTPGSNSNSATRGSAANNNSASGNPGTNDSTTESNSTAGTQNDTRSAADEMLPPVSLFKGWLVLSHSVEVRLLLIALLAGALGSYIHTATSFADYVGNRKLSSNWVWWYLLRPFIGMTLALVFYFVVRGGFISPSAGGSDMNPFGIAAMAGLVGMFSKQAIDKLNEVFTSLFGTKGDDKRGDKLQAPTITTVKPNSGPLAGKTSVTITGTGFLPNAGVTFGGKAATGIVVDNNGKTIAATTPAGAQAGPVDVEVINANTQKATLTNGFTYTA